MKTTLSRLFACALALGVVSAQAEEPVLHVYNWSDYIAEDTLQKFEAATGIKVVYDVYDSNEVLEAKLLAGHSGYDVVFPTDKPFAQRQIQAGIYATLDRAKLPNYKNLDPQILHNLAQEVDPGNTHVVPYMWGTTGIGYNVKKVHEALGDALPLDSWALLFDPKYAAKLSSCGLSLMDDETEVMGAALIYLGKDPNTTDPKDFQAAADLLAKVRPYIKYFHSSQYINDLANGDTCVAQGYSGDVLQARDRAEEAGNGVEVAYIIPKEGALMWVDVMAIPADAPHPDNALKFINFMMEPQIIADASNYVAYANANAAALPLVEEGIRTDPGIYPPAAVKARLVAPKVMPPALQRIKVRTWTRIKTGR